MCGIAGYLGYSSPPEYNIYRCAEVMKHRGPDDFGIRSFVHENTGLHFSSIHTRLAIIDLEKTSGQPWETERSILIFNGEIYNYLELRDILKNLGYQFSSQSDTEVLVFALECWGEKATEKLEGMWAFGWYDKYNGKLLLSRDRFGEKPLYYYRCQHGIYFSSEINALEVLSGQKFEKNIQKLKQNLIFGYRCQHKDLDTYFADIKRFPPGTYSYIDKGFEVNPVRYWSLNYHITKPELTFSDALEEVREALLHSMRLRMRADVPIAFCMSGGVDSNSLISIAKNVLKCEVHGFTVVNSDKRYEEIDLVERAVSSQGLNHTAIPINSENFLDNLKKMILKRCAPVCTISYYVHWQLMSTIAQSGYKISISGTGADELFSGYFDHFNFYFSDINPNSEEFQNQLASWKKWVRPNVRNPKIKDYKYIFENPDYRGHHYLNSDKFAQMLNDEKLEAPIDKNFCDSNLRNRMLNELFFESVPPILAEDDANSMYFSIENRSPFLDSKLAEIAYSLPSDFFFNDGKAKFILREAMKTIVPTEILNSRRKIGFNAPVEDLIDINSENMRSFLLDHSKIYDFVDKNLFEEFIKNYSNGNENSKFLFSFINTKLFLEEN